MKELLVIAISSALVSNVVLSQFLGICSFVGVSKKGLETAVEAVLSDVSSDPLCGCRRLRFSGMEVLHHLQRRGGRTGGKQHGGRFFCRARRPISTT